MAEQEWNPVLLTAQAGPALLSHSRFSYSPGGGSSMKSGLCLRTGFPGPQMSWVRGARENGLQQGQCGGWDPTKAPVHELEKLGPPLWSTHLQRCPESTRVQMPPQNRNAFDGSLDGELTTSWDSPVQSCPAQGKPKVLGPGWKVWRGSPAPPERGTGNSVLLDL